MLAQTPPQNSPVSDANQSLDPVLADNAPLAEAGNIQPPTPEPPTSNRPKIIWIGVVVLALSLLIAVGVWVYLEYQNFSQIQNQVFENETSEEISAPETSTSVMASTEPTNISTQDQPLPTSEPKIALPADWTTQEYVHNGQVVWHISHPTSSTINQSGLEEGSLQLQSEWNGSRFETQLTFPIFEQGTPDTFDRWVTNYVTTTSDLSGDVIVEKGMTEGVLIRKVKSGFLHTSGRQTDTPATLIFIWSYTTNTGETKNPALITIRQIDASERQVEDFADLFISGLHFQK